MALKPEISGELRAMVREVLRDTIPNRITAIEPVRLTNDAELQSFVARLLDPAAMEKVKGGKLRFTLAGAAVATAASDMLTGVVTEKTIDKHTSRGVIALAPDAVLTPLARDRARKLGLKIERRR